MKARPSLAARLSSLVSRLFLIFWRRKRTQRDFSEELQAHLALETDRLHEEGMSEEEASAAARRSLGNLTQAKERFYESHRWLWLDYFWQDLRFGLRQLRRNPGFTAVAVITLALGIGATTAIFSVVNGVLLRPLPYTQPERLVSVQEAGHGIGSPVSYPDFFDWQKQNQVFSSIASYHPQQFILTGIGEPLHIQAVTVSASLFGLLGAKPQMGRGFEPRDDQRGRNVVVLSHQLWSQRFNSNPSIIGQTIALNNRSFTVIGVMPAGFQFPITGHVDLWTSIAADREAQSNIMTGRGYHALGVIARLKSGVSLASAQTNMNLITRRLAHQYPQTNAQEKTVRIMPELDRIVGNVRLPLLILLGVVAGVLLIACVNVANLSLARNVARRKEIAVRAALGAHRSRIFRQLLSESVLLSLFGGAAGIFLAVWGAQALLRLAPGDLPRASQIGLDWRVLAFAAALSLAMGILFGSVPAGQASKPNLTESLKEAGRAASQGASERRLRSALVIVEIALALVLLMGAGLLISSYLRLVHVDPGFDPHNLLTFSVDIPTPPYTDSGIVNFINQLLPQLRALPGVRSTAADWALPFSDEIPYTGIDFKGRTFAPGYTPGGRMDAITPDYFRTMGIPLLQGRAFTDRDTAKSLPVVVVNQAFAHRYYPNESPIGKQIRPSFTTTSTFPWREIVGVVGNTKLGNLAENFEPEFYLPFAQVPVFNVIILRSQSKSLALTPAVRTVIASMDKNVPVYRIMTMDDYLSASVARGRFSTLLLGLFGFVAVVMAAAGIYGVISYSVNQRTHEIGIRMALGAQKRDVLRLVVGQGMILALIGVGIGIIGALGLTRFLSSLLYGVKPTDPLTFVVVSLILTAVALLACYIPARRAMKIDPMEALRYE